LKRTILLIAAFATLISCKKNANEIPNIDKALSPNIELVVKGATEEESPLYQWSATYNFLGFGFDATDKFNDEASVRASVVDVSTYVASGPDKVDLNRSTEASWDIIEAENAVDLSEKFSNSFNQTNGLRLFGNTVGEMFNGTVAADKKYIYGYYSNYLIWKRLKFYYDQNVNNFLTAGFKRDITLLSAQELVNKYGTHVLTEIKVGSKFDVFYQAEAPDVNRKSIVREGVRYALKRTFGLISGYLDDVNLQNLDANSSARIYYSSIGGDISKLKSQTINNRLMLNITDWRFTATEDKARFIGANSNGLVTLDNFIDDVAKKAEVKSYLKQYFGSKAVRLIN
jgi:hypothetical protein